MCSRRIALACPFNEEIRRFEDVECLFRMYKKTKVYLQPIPVMIENVISQKQVMPVKIFGKTLLAILNSKEKFLGANVSI